MKGTVCVECEFIIPSRTVECPLLGRSCVYSAQCRAFVGSRVVNWVTGEGRETGQHPLCEEMNMSGKCGEFKAK